MRAFSSSGSFGSFGSLSLGLVLAVSSLVACTAQTTDAPRTTSSSESALSQAGNELYGTYDFVLEESDVAAQVKSGCEKQSGGDAAKARACFDEVKAEASDEHIAFAAGTDGNSVYRSLGRKDGKEVVFSEVPVSLAKRADTAPGKGAPTRVFIATIRGEGKGPMAAKRPMPVGKEFVLERLDETRLALTDPEKGRLVFRRAK